MKWIFFDLGATLVDESDVYKSRCEYAISHSNIGSEEFMKKKTIFIIIILLLITVFVYIHRRVIHALIKGEPMPKAPSWHVWVPEKDRIQG